VLHRDIQIVAQLLLRVHQVQDLQRKIPGIGIVKPHPIRPFYPAQLSDEFGQSGLTVTVITIVGNVL
jgi:hypothetical protein